MNDYGLISALQKCFEKDPLLEKTLTGFYAHVPVRVYPPYVVVEIRGVGRDVFDPPRRFRVELNIKVFTRLPGVKQMHQLMTHIQNLLENNPLPVIAHNVPLNGYANFLIDTQEVSLQKDGITRVGDSCYVVWIRGQ